MLRNRRIIAAEENKFWPGFSMGIAFTTLALFLFGTKSGRRIVRKLLEAAEDFEGSLEDIIDEIEEAGGENGFDGNFAEVVEKSEEGIHGVIDKIKSVLPAKKEVKRYFVREGKIVK